MRRKIFIFLIVSSLAFAALDQTYVQDVSREGTSEITKSTDITLFAAGLDEDVFDSIKEVCDTDAELVCSIEDKTITMTERFSPGVHYSFEADYGFPSITYTFTLKKVATDRFAASLDRLLLKAGAIDELGGAVPPIDLGDRETNLEGAALLRQLKANITYVVNMPTDISEASAGTVDGSSVTLDVASLMEKSEPVTVRCTELNMAFLIVIGAVIVLGALALSFVIQKK